MKFQSVGPDTALYQLFHPEGRLGRRLPAGCSIAQFSGWVHRLAGDDPDLVDDLQEHLDAWGWRLVFHLCNSGLKFVRYPDTEFVRRAGTWNHRLGIHSKAGQYEQKANQVTVTQSHWSARVIHHETGHALDRMVSSRGDSSFSTNLWHGFAPTRSGFITDYAATHPEEYLAVCIERFLCSHQDTLWLEHNDPGMHAFLQALFQLSEAD